VKYVPPDPSLKYVPPYPSLLDSSSLEHLSIDKFLKFKDIFLNTNLPKHIAHFSIHFLDDYIHTEIMKKASLWALMTKNIAPRGDKSIKMNDVKKDLIKMYIRYFNVYIKKILPPSLRKDPDVDHENFKFRFQFVLKDMDEKTELDKIILL
jgi:hypothetical protein